MGKKNFAEWKLQDQMAQTENNEFISQNCWTSGCKSKVEAKEIQDLIDGQTVALN
jgi:peptidyl-dipeptidase Dcp